MQPFRASLKDIQRILPCAREFTAVLGVSLNEPCYTAFWRRNLISGSGAMFLFEQDGMIAGGIGGTLNENPLTGTVSAVEQFWYVKPEHRGRTALRLHAAFEDWATEQGAADVNMVFMEKSMPERLKAYYERCGYALLETVYQKKLARMG